MEIKIATRQCADQRGNPRRFHYFLTVDQEETPRFFCENYGVLAAMSLFRALPPAPPALTS